MHRAKGDRFVRANDFLCDNELLAAIAPTYRIHTDVMSDVVLENTLDIKCIF